MSKPPAEYPTFPEESIFIPMAMKIYHPHVCAFETLRVVEDYYHAKWIPRSLYEAWMSMNLGDYRVIGDKKILELWKDRFACKKDDDYILTWKGERPSYNLRVDSVKYNKCKKHKGVLHAQLCNINVNSCKRDDFKVLNTWFPFQNNADKSKTRLDVASFTYHCIKAGRVNEINFAFKHIPMGLNNSMALMYLIMAVGNKHSKLVFDLIKADNACGMGVHAQRTYHSAITTAMRRSKQWADGSDISTEQMTNCAYWYMSVGRSEMRTDWSQEKRNRTDNYLPLCQPYEHQRTKDSNARYVKSLRKHMRAVYSEMQIGLLTWDTWANFIESRQAWLSSGSSGGKKVPVGDKKFRANKRTAIEEISEEELLSYLDLEPKLCACGSEKCECGKPRAIYCTQIIDYIITSYVIMPLERSMNKVKGIESGLRGEDEVAAMQRKLNSFSDKHTWEGVMLDYKDFNLQHTLEAQHALYDELYKVMTQLGFTGDVMKAVRWVAESKLNQHCRFAGEKEYLRITQGMFSGQRDTDFTNTLMNVCYFRNAVEWVQKTFQIEGVIYVNVHKGDDLWLVCNNRLWAACVMKALLKSGLIMQYSKQLLGSNIGEFLRVVYDSDGARGYLGRAVATLTIAPLQSAVVVSPSEKAGAANKQIMTLFRRGISQKCCDILYNAIIPYCLHARVGTSDAVTIPYKVASRARVDNGLGINRIGNKTICDSVVASVPCMTIKNHTLYNKIKDNTSRAWVRHISKAIREPIDAEAVRDKAHEANLSDSIPPEDGQIALRQHVHDLRNWKHKCQAQLLKSSNVVVPLVTPVERIEQHHINKYEEWRRALSHRLAVKKYQGYTNDFITLILRAIGTSPFKDLDTAMKATGKNSIEAAYEAIRLARNADRAIEARQALDGSIRILGRDVVTYLLQSIDGYDPGFEAYIHPVICSWIHSRVIDLVLREAISLAIKDVSCIRRLLYTVSCNIMSYAVHKGDWQALSKY